MKLRLIPILLLLVSIAGVVLYVTTPVVLTKVQYVREISNTDFVQSFNVGFGGDGDVTAIGEYLGVPVNEINLIEKDGWDYYFIDVEPYPDVAMYLSFVGLGLAFLGMFLSIFGYSNGLRIAGALIAIIGGGLGLAGSFMLFSWNTTFQEECAQYIQVNAGFMFVDSYDITYSTFGPGWLATVISSGLIVLGSILLLIIKPKK